MVKAHETFVKELKIKQPNLIVLDNYVHSNQKLRVQDSLGIIYLAEPAKLLRGCKLNITTAIDKYDYFLKKSKEIHGDKYDYSQVIYKDYKTKVKIICPIHGEFEQLSRAHIYGKGCSKCARENNINSGGMLSIYKYKPETEVILYYFELENEEGKFYKIGLSCNLDPSKRLKGMHKTFNRKVIEFEKGLIKDLYPKEQEYHKFFKEIGINYQPIHKFDGYTECFKW